MKNIDFNPKNNYSRAGKASAKTFSYVIDREERLNKILKDKPYKGYIEEDYFEKKDELSFDDSKDLIYEDIFDKNYKDHYKILLRQQKMKYFKSVKSCGFNKIFFPEANKNEMYSTKYNKVNQIKESKNKEKLLHLEQNPNKSYIYKKIIYSQSFEKMLGRYDLEKTREEIREKLKLNVKPLNKSKKAKKKQTIEITKKDENSEYKTEKTKSKTIHTKQIKAVDMDKMLDREYISDNNDVRIRTSKFIRNKIKSPTFIQNISPLSSFINKKRFSFRANKLSPTIRNNIRQKSLLIKDEKKFISDKIDLISKRIFSGLSSAKKDNNNTNNLKRENSSLSNNLLLDKPISKEIYFTPKFNARRRNFSGNSFTGLKRTTEKNNSFTFNSKSKTCFNFHENNKNRKRHFRLISSKAQPLNNTFSFKKMLSRAYVNRIQINDKIGANRPLEPNYSSIYPKIVQSVKYSTLNNLRKNPPQRDLIGRNVEEKKSDNDLSQYINFSKMFGRGKIRTDYPVFMNNLNSRSAFDLLTVKSLEMNHFSKMNFNTPISCFNSKKSFNSNISNNNINNRPDSIKNLKIKKEKEIRIKNYNKNIENIFKKVIYDDIIDKNDIKEEMFTDFKKNTKLIKAINLSYKNLMSDYYKLNLDHLDKNLQKKKIDGITFQVIKGKNQNDSIGRNNPLKINASEIDI